MKTSIGLLAAALLGGSFSYCAKAQDASILTYHGDASRRGNFVVPALTWEKARSLHIDRNFDARVSGHLYAQPLLWRAAGANTAMLIAASEDDVVQAFDAETGRELWKRAVGNPVPRASLPCGNINPLGITGTPVIDPSGEAIYFDAVVNGVSGVRHQIFGLSLKDGSVLRGWPIDIADALRLTDQMFDPRYQNQRSALTILDGMLYVPFGGHYGDCGDYYGWVVGVSLHDPGKVVSWQTRARGGGIWAPGGLSTVGRELFFATGNTFGTANWSDGEAVWRLSPDLRRRDDKQYFFAPIDWRALDQRDEDLGGTNPIPLDVPGPRDAQPLMLSLGKDGKAYLLNRDYLGGIGGQSAVVKVSNNSIRTSPAAYPVGDNIFVAFQGAGTNCPGPNRGLTALRITGGSPPTMTTAWCASLQGAGSPIVTTTDGYSDPIVWILGAEGDDQLHGFRGDTGEPIFGAGGAALTGLHHFQTLIATESHLYVGADGRLYKFSF